MWYRIYTRTNWDREKRESIPVKWEVTWDITTNSLCGYGSRRPYIKIAGQDRKMFKDKEKAEKYLQGRIKAYSHLFKEINPIVPKEYEECFKVNGLLLPGYVVEEEKENGK